MKNTVPQHIKDQARDLPSFTNIGKNGINENTIMQLERHLQAHRLSKLKVLRTYLDSAETDIKTVAEELAEKTSSIIVDIKGFTIVFWKRPQW